jgi:hypothetical protein
VGGRQAAIVTEGLMTGETVSRRAAAIGERRGTSAARLTRSAAYPRLSLCPAAVAPSEARPNAYGWPGETSNEGGRAMVEFHGFDRILWGVATALSAGAAVARRLLARGR